MKIILSILLTLGLFTSPGDEPKAIQGTFALTNARIVTVTNGTIENGTLIIRNDRIVDLGTDVEVPGDAEVIDATGLSIYPGMIDAGTELGLVEIGQVDESNDASEIGDLIPQMEALTAVNPNSVLIPVTRVNGITTVIAEPSGGLLPGTAALINLHGYTPDQMHAGNFKAVMLEFPTGRQGGGFFQQQSPEDRRKAKEEAMKYLNDVWDQAEVYAGIVAAYEADPEANRRPAYVPNMGALVPVIRGERPLIIRVNTAENIEAALTWVQERDLENVIFSGVAEGWRVADKIAAAGIPCLVGPVQALPTRESDRYDRAYANAGLLHQAGVQVALRTGDAGNVRNLPYHAGFAAAYGLGREEALRAVTIGPAEVFGVADELGSLEVGKKANLFVTDGDPFETRTTVHHVFIDGYLIPMESQHSRLYEEFLNRDPGLEKHRTPTVQTN